jgi:hypothetical protein
VTEKGEILAEIWQQSRQVRGCGGVPDGSSSVIASGRWSFGEEGQKLGKRGAKPDQREKKLRKRETQFQGGKIKIKENMALERERERERERATE